MSENYVVNVLFNFLLFRYNADNVKDLETNTCNFYKEEDKWAPDDTAYKQWSCHSSYKWLCKLYLNLPPPEMGSQFIVLGQASNTDPLDGGCCSS